MAMIELRSKLLDGFEYQKDRKALTVYLSNGQIREFSDISEGLVVGLLHSSSPGSYYMTVLQGRAVHNGRGGGVNVTL